MEQGQGSGVQSIERTIAVVRAVAREQKDGARLVDIAKQAGLTKSTAHRILKALLAAGWIEQGRERGRFRLGMELHAFGLAAASRHELAGLGERAAIRLADQVGDTAYFQLRAGLDSICLARRSGSYPVKILSVDVGVRRPLGMGAGNIAILAFLGDDEIESIIGSNLGELRTYAARGVKFDAPLFRKLVRETRRRGHSYVDGLFIPGMAAVGVPIMGADGMPVGALSIAAVTDRLKDERRANAVASLQREVSVIESRLRKSGKPVLRLAATGR